MSTKKENDAAIAREQEHASGDRFTRPALAREQQEQLKVYILIRECIPLGHAINCAAHASLAMYLRHHDNPVVHDWAHNSFRKVTCKVTDAQFEYAKSIRNLSGNNGYAFELIEEEGLEQPEVALIFLPRNDWGFWFKRLELYK